MCVCVCVCVCVSVCVSVSVCEGECVIFSKTCHSIWCRHVLRADLGELRQLFNKVAGFRGIEDQAVRIYVYMCMYVCMHACIYINNGLYYILYVCINKEASTTKK